MFANIIAALCVVALFAALVHVTGLVERTRSAIDISRAAAEVLRDPSLSDDDKERVVRKSTLRLFALLGALIVGSAVAVFAPLIPLWLADKVGLASMAGTLALFVRLDFLLLASVLGTAAYLVLSRWFRKHS